MSAPTIDLNDVREAGQLISIDDTLAILGTTEPMDDLIFNLDGSSAVRFDMPLGWNDDIRDKPSDALSGCTVEIDSNGVVNLTKEAILKMTSSIGLTKDYVMRTPGPLVDRSLNWWVRNSGVKGAEQMRLMVKDDTGVAFVKDTLSTFNNIPLVQEILSRVRGKYGNDELFVDYKIAHSLERTALRLIVPARTRTIHSARHSAGDNDDWSLGIQFTNSLMGDPETRLNVSGYLFAWWCTNGAISTHATSGNYNRRVQGQDYNEVMEWVGASVDKVFEDLEPELDDIESLTTQSLEGEINDVVTDVFKAMHVPVPARKAVVDHLVDSDDLTAYGLMQAVTQAANDPAISDKVRENTMRVGGVIPHTIGDRCESCHRVNV